MPSPKFVENLTLDAKRIGSTTIAHLAYITGTEAETQEADLEFVSIITTLLAQEYADRKYVVNNWAELLYQGRSEVFKDSSRAKHVLTNAVHALSAQQLLTAYNRTHRLDLLPNEVQLLIEIARQRGIRD